MPAYSFTDGQTVWESHLTFAERDQYLKENPQITQCLAAPAIGDSIRMGLKKPDDAFRDRLKEIKKIHSQGTSASTINTF